MQGLGLLPCDTVFSPQKTRTRVQAQVLPEQLSGARLDGYEIHMGKTTRSAGTAFCTLTDGKEDGTVLGNVFGTYLHGLFDTGDLVEKLANWLLKRKGLEPQTARVESHWEYKQRQYDILAQAVRENLDMEKIYAAMDAYAKED